VVGGPNGVAVFDALHRRHKASDAILYAGAALRPLPLGERKAKLARLQLGHGRSVLYRQWSLGEMST
jgi:hypothetical protein